MKRFFEPENAGTSRVLEQDTYASADDLGPAAGSSSAEPSGRYDTGARIAVYDDLTSAPRVETLQAGSPGDFIEDLSIRTYELAHGQGGKIPYTVIREVVENLIHARFAEVVVSILDDGTTVRFSDHGPGIEDKERSFVPGFSTATQEMKQVIRGVGSGLPIVKESLSFAGGYVSVEDNLGTGTVVTLRLEPEESVAEDPPIPEVSLTEPTVRQKRVLSLAMELGSVGPSAIARELGVALSTAYRDLAALEENGFMESVAGGKRKLTDRGVSYLDTLFG